jgi:hypothetical protein
MVLGEKFVIFSVGVGVGRDHHTGSRVQQLYPAPQQTVQQLYPASQQTIQ